ncbi:MFS general substrate transporter [Aspergillus phoenicis ATCC 13157]|uniref:MFS general substrate transporter n=1 Tax=Aspergillus phoenicis ATCC 13157 TaxID=1353007 RepID=A0A370PWI4_ASPPH|nr:MFS general substrate transporter [Aspergillus phoenicis ATCC 13157]
MLIVKVGPICLSQVLHCWATAFQPLYGQSANIFGRRSLITLPVIIFAIGSAVSGSTKFANALIVGHTNQGVGDGGIDMLVDIIVLDLVPLRERPKYIGIIVSVFAVALSRGPVIGGIMTQRVTWRWIFYMNLSISGVALAHLVLLLRTEYNKDSIRDMLKRVDLAVYAPLVASAVGLSMLGPPLNAMNSTGDWVRVQVLTAAGSGVLLTAPLPAIEAPLPEADVAVATATWAFLRGLGGI